MQSAISRRKFITSAMAFAAITAAGGALTACSGGTTQTTVRVGTMPTEDILPMWVATSELSGDLGVGIEVVSFDSAQNLSAAITAGEVDLAMTDPMRAVKLVESGTDVIMEWVTLGTDASQGRFGVLAPQNKNSYSTLAEFAEFLATADFASSEGVGVGVGANTVPEYVFDKLCEQEGVDYNAIEHIEVASLPERYSLVAEGKLMAAALPNSMLCLGEASGMQVIADDTQGDNISQSVMVARTEFVQSNAAAVLAVAQAWDAAATLINADPENYRQLLIDNANLNDAVADTYPISVYPPAMGENGTTSYPAAELVDPVIAWMQQKGYVEGDVAYNESDGTITIS